MLLAPTRIDRYEIKGRIGGGGMGTLYLARDTNPTTDRLVALKLLRSSFDSDELRQRFRREARALAELNHPNIVVIYDSGEFDGSPFIVMEYVRGKTLAESLRRHAPIPIAETLRLLAELAAGLAHAHAAGIIHRDIKPANLVVDLNGRLKILDFGIARLDADATARDGQLTLVASQMGTPGYMSPEQLEGRDVDARSDVFAAGAVAYELLSGREPFAGATTAQIEQRVIGEQPLPLTAVVPGLDPAIAEIVAGALEKDVRQRCQSAAELAEAFERARARLPEESRQPRQTPQPPRPSGERRSRRERAADVAYGRAVNSYREGAEECARRFAMEAIAEDPQHAGARQMLVELGRFRDVEPWLPSPTSETMVATPGAAFDSSETLVITPGASGFGPVPGTEVTESGTVVAPLPPKPPQQSAAAPPPQLPPAPPPKPSQPATPPRGPARGTAAPRPAVSKKGLSPVVRFGLIAGGIVVVLAAAVVAVWMVWLKGAGGETLTVTRPDGGTIEGDGIQCGTQGSRCTATPSRGATVQLRALADAGFVFAGFTGDCVPGGRTVMDAARSCGATFVRDAAPPTGAGGPPPATDTPVENTAPPAAAESQTQPQARVPPAGTAGRKPAQTSIQWWVLTITKPTGGTILGENIKCGAEGSDCGARYPGGYAVTLRHQAEAGYTFGAFTGDCSPAGKTVMAAARICGATFAKAAPAAPAAAPAPVVLTVMRPADGTIVGNGIECGPAVAHCASPQPAGASVRLMARPKAGFVFTGFTDDCDAGGLVVMTAARTCGATFAKADLRLPAAAFPMLTVNRPRNGTIVGPGIECGTAGSRCKAPQPAGSTLLLRVQPDPGFVFVRFTGDCDAGGLTVMSAPKLCAVSIVSLKDALPNEVGYPTLTIPRPTGGTVIGNGIECGTGGSACSAPQPGARQVRLLARPDVGFVFIRFTGDCDASGVAMMDGPRTCGAVFSKGGAP